MHWASSQFFDQTFDETLSLLEETKHHVDMVAHGDLNGVAQGDVLRTVRDLSYLTSQMTGMMSLLMLYKAAAEGSVSEDDFRSCAESLTSELEMTGAAIAKETMGAEVDMLPPMLVSLMERGDRLMHRIYSLQGMKQATHALHAVGQ